MYIKKNNIILPHINPHNTPIFIVSMFSFVIFIYLIIINIYEDYSFNILI